MNSTTFIEVNNAETFLLYVLNKDYCNKVTTDYKKNINTYKAPAKKFKTSMEKNYGYNRKSWQAIYFSAIFQVKNPLSDI